MEVVWSSVTGSPRKKIQCQTQNSNSVKKLPFKIDVTPNKRNLDMLRGDSSKIWLSNYRAPNEKNLRKKENNKRIKRKRVEERQKENEKAEETEPRKKKRRKSPEEIPTGKLRKIVIDGCNVAKEYVPLSF